MPLTVLDTRRALKLAFGRSLIKATALRRTDFEY
jgi:hypothetical protein